MSSRATEATAGGANHSLRRRLLLVLLAAVALAGALQATSAYRTALRSADALFDAQLQAMARALQGGVPIGGAGVEPDFSVQIWREDGVLLFGLGRARLPAPAMIGFSEAVVNGVPYRMFSLRAGDRAVQIAQDLDARRQRARALALDAVLPVASLGLLLMLAVWIVIECSLAPVERLRREVATRAPDVLSPVAEDGLPQEVRPLVRELNLLLARAGESLEAQQRFVADAAHELRSPLTALRLQVESLRREPPGATLHAAISRMEEGLARAVALVNQLLALAREEGTGTRTAMQVALEDLCREVVSEVLPLARSRRIDVGVDQAAGVSTLVRGDPDSLRVLLRNLLDNAVKYAGDGGRVDILLESTPDGGALLAVEDDGPGIEPDERQLVFDRFHRGAGQDMPGSGLGLAIVAAVARRHGAAVRLDRSARLGGLRAEVSFPPSV